MARELQSRFTDEVIERALRQMPAEWYAINGAETAAMLRTRRAGLQEYVLRVYEYYARIVDVHATDRNERVAVARGADGSVEVTIALADGGGDPYYRRRFALSETEEVRIYLHGGDDAMERTGPAGGPISVRVVAGGGRDTIDDSKSDGTDVWRDAGTIDVKRGEGTHVRETPWTNPVPVEDAPWIEPRSYGQWTVSGPLFGYAPDVLFYLGYGFTRTTWGFRTSPAKSVQTLRGALTTGEANGKLEYIGTFHRPASGVGWQLHAFGSGMESFNYFGSGNNSPESTDRGRYKTRENVFLVTPTVRYDAGRRVELYAGPELRYSDTPSDATTIVGEQAPLGVGSFGLVALRGGVTFDSRERSVIAPKADYTNTSMASGDESRVSGVKLAASGFVVPQAWDVTQRYGGVDGLVAGYLGNARAHLAVRGGGRKLWGDYPWFDAATVGGANNRGFSNRRFSGDSSLYGTVSLRTWLGQVSSPVLALRFGVIGFSDVGRVWVRGEDSRTWHSSVGGGLLVQPASAPFTLHVIAANSKEGTRLYAGMGYPS